MITKVICIKTKYYEQSKLIDVSNRLKINELYYADMYNNFYGIFYMIDQKIGDFSQHIGTFPRSLFLTLEEYREEKIDLILI